MKTVDADAGTTTTVTDGTLTIAGPVTTGSLVQTGGLLNGGGTLTVVGISMFSGGTESGSGTTIAQGGANFSSQGFSLDGGRTLQLGGTSKATSTNASINLNGGNDAGTGTLKIVRGATIDDETTDSGFSIFASNHGGTDNGSTAAVVNQGTFKKTGSATTSSIYTAFDNTGLVDVVSGTLILGDGGIDTGGRYTGPGTVQFAGGVHTLDSTSNITSNVSFSGGQTTIAGTFVGMGKMTVGGGTATISGAMTTGSLVQTGGLLNGGGTLTATKASSFSAGTESGSGTTIAQGGANFSLQGFSLDGGRTLQLGGTSKATSTNASINLNGGNDAGTGTLKIVRGATIDDETTDSGFSIFASNHGGTDNGSTAAVVNQGTFKKTGSATTSSIYTAFDNTGLVDVVSGTLILGDGGIDTGGRYTGPGTVQFAGGVHTLDSTSNITSNVSFSGGQTTIAGTFVGMGKMTVGGGTATISGAMTTGSLVQTGGLLNGGGTLTATKASSFSAGTESGSGTTIAQGGANFSLQGFSLDGGRTLQLGGTSKATSTNASINLNGGNDAGTGTLKIVRGATIDDETTDSGFSIFASNHGGTDNGSTAVVVNQGTFKKTGSATTSSIYTAFDNTGLVDVVQGALDMAGAVTNNGTIDVGANAKLHVSLALNGAGTVDIHGASSVVDLEAGSSNAFVFTDASAATLKLDHSSAFTGPIKGFVPNSILDLADVLRSSASMSYTQDQNGGTLAVTDGTHEASIAFTGSYKPGQFVLSTDASGGTLVKIHA